MAIAPQRSEIGIRRHFTTEGVHPYDEVRWERRDARITNYRDGTVAFEQLGVEVPESWSVNATNILSQKYFRGTLNTDERESSLMDIEQSRWIFRNPAATYSPTSTADFSKAVAGVTFFAPARKFLSDLDG